MPCVCDFLVKSNHICLIPTWSMWNSYTESLDVQIPRVSFTLHHRRRPFDGQNATVYSSPFSSQRFLLCSGNKRLTPFHVDLFAAIGILCAPMKRLNHQGTGIDNVTIKDGSYIQKEVVPVRNKKSILIVDHNSDFRKFGRKILKNAGYEVFTSDDGEKGIEFLSKTGFSLVIAEQDLPDMDGDELIREMDKQKIEAPILFVASPGDVESYLDLMNMGAFDYLNKPVKGKRLLHVVERAVNEPT